LERFGQVYGPFGVKYLVEMPIQPLPDWEDSDERWEGYDPHVAVLERFHDMFEHRSASRLTVKSCSLTRSS
jgi:hypothetical protein